MLLTKRHFCLIALSAAAIPGAAQATLPEDIHAHITRERAKNGLGTLARNARLQAAAQGLADAMLRRRTLSHSADGQTLALRARAYPYRRLAENIAYIDSRAPGDIAARFAAMWMQSPGHRANILDGRLTETGIAVAASGTLTYAAQLFGTPR